MKTVKTVSPFLWMLFSFLSGPAFADEMYRCGGTYSNKPCDDGSSPIQNLPKVSKMGSSSEVIPSAEDKVEEKKLAANRERPGCKVETNGADVKISGMNSTVQKGVLSFTGTVRNSSPIDVKGGVNVEVRRLGGREVTIEKVSDSLSGGTSTAFSYFAPAGTPLQSTFEFRLLYAPAKSCEVYRASGASAELQEEGNGSTTGAASQKTRYAQALKDLDTLEADIKVRRAKRVRSKTDPEEVAAVVRFQGRLNSLCITGMKDGDLLDRKCQKVKELLDSYF